MGSGMTEGRAKGRMTMLSDLNRTDRRVRRDNSFRWVEGPMAWSSGDIVLLPMDIGETRMTRTTPMGSEYSTTNDSEMEH